MWESLTPKISRVMRFGSLAPVQLRCEEDMSSEVTMGVLRKGRAHVDLGGGISRHSDELPDG